MNRNNTFKSVLIGLLAAAWLFSCQTGSQPSDEEVAAKTSTPDSIAVNEITLTESQYRAIGVQLGSVQNETVSSEVKANGRVDLPPENRATVSLPIGGKIRYVNTLPGQRVRKGELLATLESFDFIQLQQDYLQNSSQLTFLGKELERQKTLSGENVGARKNYEKAQADYDATQALTQSLAAKMKLLGLSVGSLEKNGIAPTARIVSPVNGYITIANINLGKQVAPGEELLEIIDKSHMHIELNVFEQEAALIKKGQEVRIIPASGAPMQAYVHLVGRMLEGESRSLNIHAHVRDEKREQELIPGEYVSAYIRTGSRTALTVPPDALVRKGANGFIYIEKNSREFHRIPVEIGDTAESGSIAIKTPVELTGQKLVTKGAYLIDAEFAKRSEPEE
ncbi:efflux RND transporter periplasmic adaptor subunit [Persicitalea jodogahamensis]|uniref:Hemolysin D n=1 Tax=Persicitalea jodogahamensis TaxID=402147 RepID=A0A8J3GB57_9BACT|nr:efflux RND transporter periplasmic adaptor subunit [Persicitalea jodogahamensis]GHB85063.1 hemolysin D [Persicitalea jodogahamensis]